MAGLILVVDDDVSNRVLMEEILRSQGFEVITATDGLDGLATSVTFIAMSALTALICALFSKARR